MNNYLKSSLIFFLITWLFVGVFYDDEFREPEIFIKYRPTFKLFFHSPIGMQDLKISDLSIEMQKEELAFQEFVGERQFNNYFSFLPYILIQLIITSLLFGGIKSTLNFWKFIIHFLINHFPTSMGIVLLLVYDRIFISLGIILILILVNFLSFKFLQKLNFKENSR